MLTRGVAQVVKSNITGYKRVKAGDPFSQQLGHWDVAALCERLLLVFCPSEHQLDVWISAFSIHQLSVQ